MLVLSRKQNESILLPTLNISITILRTGCGRVQVGIEAPRDIPVTRPELAAAPGSSGRITATAS